MISAITVDAAINHRNSGSLPLPLGVSDLAVGSEPEFVWLLAAVVGLALILLIRSRIRFAQMRRALN